MQWGRVTTNNSMTPQATFTFPRSFSNLYAVTFSPNRNSNDQKFTGRILSFSTSSVYIQAETSANGLITTIIHILAVGNG